MPVRVQREADTIATVVVSKDVLIHEGDGSNSEPKQPDRGKDHLRGRTGEKSLFKSSRKRKAIFLISSIHSSVPVLAAESHSYAT